MSGAPDFLYDVVDQGDCAKNNRSGDCHAKIGRLHVGMNVLHKGKHNDADDSGE